MSVTNFKGAIHDQLLEFFSVKDGYSIGEKLTHLEKQLGKKKFFYAQDEEIFDALNGTIKDNDYYIDEPLTLSENGK